MGSPGKHVQMFTVFQLYDNMKREAKKANCDEKVARKKTGGGSCKIVVGEVQQKVLGLLGNRAKPLCNPFDGDADYYGDHGTLITVIYIDYLNVDKPEIK